MIGCVAGVFLACKIAGWLTAANSGQLPPYWQFRDYHVKAVLDTVKEESSFQPCILSRHGDDGLFQFRGSRRTAMHQQANVSMRHCVPAEAQVQFMIRELKARKEASWFFDAKDYRAARSVFVRYFEVRRSDLIQAAGL